MSEYEQNQIQKTIRSAAVWVIAIWFATSGMAAIGVWAQQQEIIHRLDRINGAIDDHEDRLRRLEHEP